MDKKYAVFHLILLISWCVCVQTYVPQDVCGGQRAILFCLLEIQPVPS